MSVGPKWRKWDRPNTRFMWARRDGDRPRSLDVPKDRPKLWKVKLEELNAWLTLSPHAAERMYGPSPAGTRFGEAAKRYLAAVQTATSKGGDSLSAATKAMRAQQIKPLVRHFGDSARVSDLRARDVHEDHRLVDGERLARELDGLERHERLRVVRASRLPYTAARLAEGVSYSTIKKELHVLGKLLKICEGRAELAIPVASLVPSGWSARYRPRTTVLTESQAQTLLDALTPGARRASIAFLIGTGARRSEWWRATPYAHLDFTGETITLLGSKTKRARRTFWMSPVSRPFLEICIRELPAVPEEERATFEFVRWTNVRRDLLAACDKAGVPRVSLNDLRRTFATLQARGGIAREDLVRAMGHSDDTMLRRVYDQTDEADHVRAARARYLRDHPTPGPANPAKSEPPAGEQQSA